LQAIMMRQRYDLRTQNHTGAIISMTRRRHQQHDQREVETQQSVTDWNQ